MTLSAESLISGLAVIGAGTCVYWLVRGLSALVRLAQASVEPEAAGEPPPAQPAAAAAANQIEECQIEQDHIAAIAAAVACMMQSHRIVHIESAHSGAVWLAEGRWMHQTSHRPH